MKRRAFLSSVTLGAHFLSLFLAREASAEVQPYREVHVAADAKRVFVFFSFSCSACRLYHHTLEEWGKSLPSALSFEFIPVVVPDAEHVLAARGWYAARIAAPSRLSLFADALYSQIHDAKKSLSRPETMLSAAKTAGIPGFANAWTKVSESAIRTAAELLAQYQITETPSMAIGGRYVITPNNANGDEKLFIALANGLASKQLREAS